MVWMGDVIWYEFGVIQQSTNHMVQLFSVVQQKQQEEEEEEPKAKQTMMTTTATVTNKKKEQGSEEEEEDVDSKQGKKKDEDQDTTTTTTNIIRKDDDVVDDVRVIRVYSQMRNDGTGAVIHDMLYAHAYVFAQQQQQQQQQKQQQEKGMMIQTTKSIPTVVADHDVAKEQREQEQHGHRQQLQKRESRFFRNATTTTTIKKDDKTIAITATSSLNRKTTTTTTTTATTIIKYSGACQRRHDPAPSLLPNARHQNVTEIRQLLDAIGLGQELVIHHNKKEEENHPIIDDDDDDDYYYCEDLVNDNNNNNNDSHHYSTSILLEGSFQSDVYLQDPNWLQYIHGLVRSKIQKEEEEDVNIVANSTMEERQQQSIQQLAVIIRRGDIDPCRYGDRYLFTTYYHEVLDQLVLPDILRHHHHHHHLGGEGGRRRRRTTTTIPLHINMTVYSESESAIESIVDFCSSYLLLERSRTLVSSSSSSSNKGWWNVSCHMALDLSLDRTWMGIVQAHYVVLSRSSFSYVPALLNPQQSTTTTSTTSTSGGGIYYAPFWHPPLPSWTSVMDATTTAKDNSLTTTITPTTTFHGEESYSGTIDNRTKANNNKNSNSNSNNSSGMIWNRAMDQLNDWIAKECCGLTPCRHIDGKHNNNNNNDDDDDDDDQKVPDATLYSVMPHVGRIGTIVHQMMFGHQYVFQHNRKQQQQQQQQEQEASTINGTTKMMKQRLFQYGGMCGTVDRKRFQIIQQVLQGMGLLDEFNVTNQPCRGYDSSSYDNETPAEGQQQGLLLEKEEEDYLVPSYQNESLLMMDREWIQHVQSIVRRKIIESDHNGISDGTLSDTAGANRSETEATNMTQVAVIVRRGDVNPCHHGDRYLPNSYYRRVLDRYVPNVHNGRKNAKVNVTIHSLPFSPTEPLKELCTSLIHKENNPERYKKYSSCQWALDNGDGVLTVTDAWLQIAQADYIVTSRSSFSFVAALFNAKAKAILYAPNFWWPSSFSSSSSNMSSSNLPSNWVEVEQDIWEESMKDLGRLINETCCGPFRCAALEEEEQQQ